MGLREVVGGAIATAFQAVGNIALPMTVRHYDSSTAVRDMDTGEYDESYVDTPVSAIITDIKVLQGRANVPEAEKVVLIRAAEVAKISIGDMIFDQTLTYEVLQDPMDPTAQLHMCAVRTAKVKIDATDQVASIDGGDASGDPDSVLDGGSP